MIILGSYKIPMNPQDICDKVIKWFQENMPVAETELFYKDPFQLLVAVILSAQCTDKRVNQLTPALFRRFPTPEKMAEVEPEEVFEEIKSCSYPNNKAKNLVGMARMLVSDFQGTVPAEMEELIRLPGVGRKTANVILIRMCSGFLHGLALQSDQKLRRRQKNSWLNCFLQICFLLHTTG